MMTISTLWTLHNDTDIFDLGLLPEFITEADPDDAVTQIHKNYGHGGGWNDFKGFTLDMDGTEPQLCYPGDPPMRLMASTRLRDETVFVFEYAWVAVVQPDGKYRVARID